jgi:hypothetical protein
LEFVGARVSELEFCPFDALGVFEVLAAGWRVVASVSSDLKPGGDVGVGGELVELELEGFF